MHTVHRVRFTSKQLPSEIVGVNSSRIQCSKEIKVKLTWYVHVLIFIPVVSPPRPQTSVKQDVIFLEWRKRLDFLLDLRFKFSYLTADKTKTLQIIPIQETWFSAICDLTFLFSVLPFENGTWDLEWVTILIWEYWCSGNLLFLSWEVVLTLVMTRNLWVSSCRQQQIRTPCQAGTDYFWILAENVFGTSTDISVPLGKMSKELWKPTIEFTKIILSRNPPI